MTLEISSNSITAPKEMNNSARRGLLLLSIYAFPIVLSSLVFLLVVMISDIDFSSVGSKTDYAEITSPKNQSAVEKKFTISGTLSEPLKDHKFYLLEYREKNYWPKYSMGNKAMSWNKNLTNRAKKNAFNSYLIIMADKDLSATIDNWFKRAHETGEYPGIPDLEVDHVVAKVRVQKK
ncbi:hypothetical protein [Cocleimonas flava]|uniref:Uncharacterized protein n=1 Tax=Cocleimonas flava TaxID=634765 RepID=A0A4R1F322_9GAMM|nr:hypothetical protein [Cocleimonas flava]TCJ86952.1 hypothetical protein EV695_1452 [Cocleimonas flava]